MESREFFQNVDMSRKGWAFLPIAEDNWDWLKSVGEKIVARGCHSDEFKKDFEELRKAANSREFADL